MKKTDLALFIVIVKESFERREQSFEWLRILSNKTIKRFRPKEKLSIPVEITELPPTTEGMYDSDKDRILINQRISRSLDEIINHELTHRNIIKRCRNVKDQFVYHILLEFADNSEDVWINYYFKKYVVDQYNLLKRIYNL